MHLIVGLGNPGKEYQHTRHNVGFLVVEALAREENVTWKKKASLKAEVAEFERGNEKVVLLKPQTFMNLSGEAVRSAAQFWKIPLENIVVAYDDADMEFGKIRTRGEGSGGHNGMQSIIDCLGTNAIKRVKIGIGRSEHPNVPLDEWVLSSWTKEEEKKFEEVIPAAIASVRELL